MIRFPSSFPPESRSAVIAARIRAGKDFDARKSLPGYDRFEEMELRAYILGPFLVFVKEAATLGWPADRIEEEAQELLRLSTIDAIFEKCSDRSRVRIEESWIGHWGGGIQPEAMRKFEKHVEWGQYQEVLLQVAESQAARTRSRSDGPPALKQTVAEPQGEPDRSAMVDNFLGQCNAETNVGFKVIRKHLWQAAGHARARQFERWQKGSDKASAPDDRTFLRLLNMTPAEFVALVKKKGIFPPSS
jgi:hypothetical protein